MVREMIQNLDSGQDTGLGSENFFNRVQLVDMNKPFILEVKFSICFFFYLEKQCPTKEPGVSPFQTSVIM